MAHEHEHDHEHHHAHDHAPLTMSRTRVAPDVLATLDKIHPALAEILSLGQRYAELTEDEKKDLLAQHEAMEAGGPWILNFHADGDVCAVCGEPTTALFEDALADGQALPFAAFASDLPAHPACMPEFPRKFPKMSPRALDQARRATMEDLDRPSAPMATFFRHDLMAHGSFDLEDWANSVADANPAGLTKQGARDVQKCIAWVHGKLFH